MFQQEAGRRPTVQDVARAAGMSATSVSDYFRHPEVVVARRWWVQIGDSRGCVGRKQQLRELLSALGVAGVIVLSSRSERGVGRPERRDVGARAGAALLADLAERKVAPIIVR